MAFNTIAMVSSILLLLMVSPPSTTTAQRVTSPPPLPPSPSPAPAPAPAPQFVNLTDLLTVAGPFHTFLNYLVQTQVIDTFQNQANHTEQGITIFVPSDAAFSSLKKPSLSNLTQDQLKSLLLAHALPQYYSLAEFRNLSQKNPVSTFAGGHYTLNFTDDSGLIRADSGWANPKISSSVYSTNPVAVYEVGSVLLPVAIFGAAPPPAPAPAPDTTKPSDLAPTSADTGNTSSSRSSSSSKSDSSSHHVSLGAVNCFILVISGGLMLLF